MFSVSSLIENRVNLSYYHPRLLSSLVLIDPVIHDPGSSAPADDRASSSGAQKSTFRRDRWSSRAEAKASFLKSKFYQVWDPRVLDLLVTHGLRKLPTAIYPQDSDASDYSEADDAPVTLTTTKHQEVFTFLRPKFEGVDARGMRVPNRQTHPDLDLHAQDTDPFYRSEPPRTFYNLEHLRPSILYIFGGQSPLSQPDWRKAKMERTGTGVGGSGGADEGKVKEKVRMSDICYLWRSLRSVRMRLRNFLKTIWNSGGKRKKRGRRLGRASPSWKDPQLAKSGNETLAVIRGLSRRRSFDRQAGCQNKWQL